MTILDEILLALGDDAPIRDILVGAHWTAVCSRYCGLAATTQSEGPHGTHLVRDAGRLHNKSARELAEYARSENLLEASIGLAAINSLLHVNVGAAVEINAFNVLAEHGSGKNVALVGHFPFVPRLRPSVRNLWVLEQHPAEDDYPAEAAVELIPQADVVAITSSTLINHTLDGLLRLCRTDALVMMLGPTTPLTPVLFSHGVDILSGSIIVNESAILRTIGQGASFQQVEGVRLITLRKENYYDR